MKKNIVIFILFFGLSLLMFSNEAKASGTGISADTTMEQSLCRILSFLTGGVGKAIAAFTCIGISLTFLAGKINWVTILTFSIGMACIFGAPQIIKAFSGDSQQVCSGSNT